MSNEITLPNNGQLPAYLQSYESENTDALITSGIVLPRISLRGKQFRFRKDGNERSMALGEPLRVVILGAAPRTGMAKSYYADAYAEGSDDMPTCGSSNGVAPDGWCAEPQASKCSLCPHNAFGSGRDSSGNPTKGKACADTKQLLVLPPDAPDAELWVLRVPPASLKLMSGYAAELKRHRLPIEGVVTEIYFADAEFPKIDFKFHSFIDNAHAAKFLERVKGDEFKSVVDQLSSAPAHDVAEAASDATEQVSVQQAQTKPQPQQPTGNSVKNIDWGSDDSSDEIPFSEPAQETKPEPQPKPAEPATTASKAVQAPDGSYFVDDKGTVFNPEKHSTKTGCVGGSLKQDGTFKARRNVDKSQQVQQPQQTQQAQKPQQPAATSNDFFGGAAEEPAQTTGQADDSADDDDLQSILDQWGN